MTVVRQFDMGAIGKNTRTGLFLDHELEALPDPEYLVDEYIEEGALTVVYGPPGGGKSFTVTDMSLSVANGVSWHGHDVKQRPVVYVLGEGTTGVKKRIAAWKRQRGVASMQQAYFRLEPVQLMDPTAVQGFLQQLKAYSLRPGLVVFDTLATCIVGADENSAQDMGSAIAAVRKVMADTGAAVIVVHHTGKATKGGKDAERGSSALRGAADAMLKVSSDGGLVMVKNDKRKDDALAKDFHGRLQVLDVGVDRKGKPLRSCVLEELSVNVSAMFPAVLPAGQQEALLALSRLAGGEGTTRAWRDAYGLSDGTLHRRRRSLVEGGYVELKSPGFYALTDTGRQAVMTLSGTTTDMPLPPLSHPVGVTGEVDVNDGSKSTNEDNKAA